MHQPVSLNGGTSSVSGNTAAGPSSVIDGDISPTSPILPNLDMSVVEVLAELANNNGYDEGEISPCTAVASASPELALRQPQRHPAGRPATTRQRLFDTKVKTFEKLGSVEKDSIRLSWTVSEDVVRNVIRSGDLIQASDLRSDLAYQLKDVRAKIADIEPYYTADAWHIICQWKQCNTDTEWPCRGCGVVKSSKLSNGKTQKWIQCDHCLVWFHYSCVTLTRKPKGQWFCTDCK